MRLRSIIPVLLAAVTLHATTLEQLSVERMVEESTAIVRATVQGSFVASRNGSIYTYYHLKVTENIKSEMQTTVDVAVPGGVLNGLEQSVAGAPVLTTGGDYLLFLWAGKSGLVQIIGMSQGAFDVRTDAAGELQVVRAPTSEQMLDAAGRPVRDQGLALRLSEVRRQAQQGRRR